MHPALRCVRGNVLELHPRRPELVRQAAIDAAVQRALVEAIRARSSREPVSQYDRTWSVVLSVMAFIVAGSVVGLAASVLMGSQG